MLKLLLHGAAVVLCCFGAPTISQTANFDACDSPNGETGLCLRIMDCAYMYDKLRMSELNVTDRELLKKSQCGLDISQTEPARRVLVCCPHKYLQNITASSASVKIQETGNILPEAGTCGRVLSSRILGGNVTRIDEFPWMALIEYKKPMNLRSHHCGGSLINHLYVLTAAHCVKGAQIPTTWELSRVRLGEWDLTTDPDCELDVRGNKDCAPAHVDIDVIANISHPNYVPDSRDQLHDIALLRLATSVVFTDFVRPICLPVAPELRNANFQSSVLDVAGWGQTSQSSPSGSSVKLKILVKVWPLSACQEKYSFFEHVLNDTQLCAGGDENIDTCRGDSGGPLMVQERLGMYDIYFLAGVVSYGPTPCGLQGWPGVYTKVSTYIDWIQNNLNRQANIK